MNSSFGRTKVGKTASVLVSITTAFWLSGAAAIMPMTASAQTVEELNAQIQALLAQITALQAQLSALQGGGGAVCGYTFGVDLKQGSTGTDVKNLQTVLNSDPATQVAATGVGSSGNETTYFGALTKAAAAKFQEKYAADILTPLGLTAGTGYVGASTRAKLNALFGTCVTGTPTPTGTPVSGTGISVSSPSQPSASIAVESAARLPFTKFTLTAGNDGDVTVTGIQVERTGLANDAVFAGVVLLDENGQQLGIEKTFNSDHKTTVGESFTVKAGQSRTMTIAGNMAATLDSYAGQVAYLSIVGITTSATVTGTLPITGAGHTINATLTIGSVTMTRGSTDPGANQTSKEIGVTGYTFSAVRVTAGSAEKIRINSIRWNQSGSAATSDLANVKTYVDSTAYDTVVSSDGKYYTATLGTGIVVDKGSNIELAIKGDIIGGSGRTIDFDIYKRTDLYVTGETYGYGITPPNGSSAATADTGAFSSTNPWYDAFQVTVSNGTMTVSKASAGAAAAQNIAENLANQPLGGYFVDVKGEEITVASSVFQIEVTSAAANAASSSDITNISIFDENGNVVAGPVDGVDGSTADEDGTATFTDTITYTTGKHAYYIKGKIGTQFGSNDTVYLTTTPSSNWTTVTGQTTGNTITPSPASLITMNTMTVKAGALAISVSADPVAQTVVSGGTFTFANYYFDASSAGEDIRMASVPLAYNAYGGTATNLTNCQLYDGSTSITTGSNIVNPSAAGSSTTFTFDGTGLTVSKGTIKTISLKCDIAGGATGSYAWGVDSGATFSATGLTSGTTVTPTATDSTGQMMTLTSEGTLTITLDASSPSYAIAAAAGSTGVTLAVLKFHAANEAINLQKVALQLSSTASNSPQDLTGVTLWDGSTQVGTAVFTTGDNATSTLTTTVTIPKDGDKIITVKGNLAAIGSSQPGTQGHLVVVNYDGADTTGTSGTGVNSGQTIEQGSSSDTSSDGVRVFKSFPTIAKLSVPTTTLSNGTMSLLRFKITADSAGDVGLYKVSFKVSTTTCTADSLNVYAYSDSGFSVAVSGIGSGGKMLNTDLDLETKWASSDTQLEVYPQTTAAASTTIQIPAGATRYFDVIATMSGVATGDSISTQLEGDAAYPQLAAFMGTYTQIETDAGSNNDFIWSPNATTTSLITHSDWTNGYGVSGLPSVNLSAEVLSR